MPFNSDTRCGVLKIELNVGIIQEELENILTEHVYVGDTDEGSSFWKYVCELEVAFANDCNWNKHLDFWEWFNDNYNNMDMWDTIELNFLEVE